MRLDTEFVRLPLRFDAARLAAEVAAIDPGAWQPHPQHHAGNTALLLVSRDGDPTDDSTSGVMRQTPHLEAMPYTRQVIASLRTVVGRSRLMRVEGVSVTPAHADTDLYWWEHVRVHVPVVTDPAVTFTVGDRARHLPAGEAWVFDTWRIHGVDNGSAADRVHLVVDTVGSLDLWELIEAGERPFAEPPRPATAADGAVEYAEHADPRLVYESVNRSRVMTPWQQAEIVRTLVAQLEGQDGARRLARLLDGFLRGWRAQWAVQGDTGSTARYRALCDRLQQALGAFDGRLRLDNGVDAAKVVRSLLVRAAIADTPVDAEPVSDRPVAPRQAARPARDAGARTRPRRVRRRLRRPVFVVSPPRLGSTLLFETLARSPSLWTIGGESHRVFEGIDRFRPENRGWDSNRLDAGDALPPIVTALESRFAQAARDRDGVQLADLESRRLLEKTPKNALRVPFLAAAFPDARFVYLYRDPRETVSSMLDAWRSGRFVTYPDLPGWEGLPWSLLLVRGWRDLIGKPLEEVVAAQWTATTNQLLDDLEALEPERWCVAAYDRLVADPQVEIDHLCSFLELEWDRPITDPLPPSRHTLTSPEPEKWRRNAAELERIWPDVRDTANRAHAVFAEPPATRPGRTATAAPTASSTAPFRSSHSGAVPELLERARSSLLVSTYQSGRVIAMRARDGRLNTHFRMFRSPMGMAVDRNDLAIGTKQGVWTFRNQPRVGAKLEPRGTHDACFLPRRCHVTGDIRVHELVVVGGELWVANTRFSCLSTLDERHSFVPRWRPSFISALAAEDRCHLNGIAVRDDEVSYVSCLGRSNEPQGWREHKASGGMVLDVPSGEPVVTGLSMPHSPRWHDGRLWILESGKGEINVVDPETGAVDTVAQLPGFTRGLAFVGPYAVVGLSQVRETIFGGIPLVERLAPDQRHCGVWIVDTRDGSVAGSLTFEGAVQEIFDIQVLQGVRWPELVEPDADLVDGSFVVPDAALSEVAHAAR